MTTIYRIVLLHNAPTPHETILETSNLSEAFDAWVFRETFTNHYDYRLYRIIDTQTSIWSDKDRSFHPESEHTDW